VTGLIEQTHGAIYRTSIEQTILDYESLEQLLSVVVFAQKHKRHMKIFISPHMVETIKMINQK